jgi:hypothetical protein
MAENLKVLTRQMDEITRRYKTAKVQVMLYQPTKDPNLLSLHTMNVQFIEAFHYVLDSMIPENREIIIKDFLNPQEHYWWFDLYARSTYYRQKNRALREILKFLGQ